MSTSVSSVVSHFPSPQNGFSTTLASTISSGATTVPLNSVVGYTNGQIGVFVVDPTDSTKKQTFTGVVDTSGVQITSVVWTAGTNQTHTSGSTVVDYATATHIAMISKGLLVAHDQTGVHKSGATYAAPVFSGTATGTYTLGGTPTITSPTIASPTISGTVTGQVIGGANLTTSAIALGYASRTTDFTTTGTSATQVTSLTTTVTIPAGGRSIEISAYAGAIGTTAGSAAWRWEIWDGTVGSGTMLAQTQGFTSGGLSTMAWASAIVTPAAGSKTYNVSAWGTSAGTTSVYATSSQVAYILVKAI